MRTSTTRRSAILGTTLVTAALGAGLVLAPAATAGSANAHLTVSASNAYNHYMFLDGFLPASGWDAANALKKYTPNFDVYGDDTYNDDWLADNRTPEMFTWGPVTSSGVYFQAKLQMPNKTLNEDTGKDEVYVMVNNVRSNNVQKRF